MTKNFQRYVKYLPVPSSSEAFTGVIEQPGVFMPSGDTTFRAAWFFNEAYTERIVTSSDYLATKVDVPYEITVHRT